MPSAYAEAPARSVRGRLRRVAKVRWLPRPDGGGVERAALPAMRPATEVPRFHSSAMTVSETMLWRRLPSEVLWPAARNET